MSGLICTWREKQTKTNKYKQKIKHDASCSSAAQSVKRLNLLQVCIFFYFLKITLFVLFVFNPCCSVTSSVRIIMGFMQTLTFRPQTCFRNLNQTWKSVNVKLPVVTSCWVPVMFVVSKVTRIRIMKWLNVLNRKSKMVNNTHCADNATWKVIHALSLSWYLGDDHVQFFCSILNRNTEFKTAFHIWEFDFWHMMCSESELH